MEYAILQIIVHLIFIGLSFYGFSSIQWHKFCDTSKPIKIQLLMIILSLGFGYLGAQLFLNLTILNGF